MDVPNLNNAGEDLGPIAEIDDIAYLAALIYRLIYTLENGWGRDGDPNSMHRWEAMQARGILQELIQRRLSDK